ncbi:MAG: M1 family metallopeptidase [Bacteroidia bacterium]|nr:M1 family metallopeptidase [Bacteroidia bacterium]
MRNLLLITLIFTLNNSLVAQKNLSQAEWQQKVDYTINVSLNDSLNVLSGYEKITYYNNSPNTLNEIFIHLWPNAYINNETPFAKQQIENNNTNFYYAEEQDRGKIDSLNFTVDGISVKAELVPGSFEICKLTLNKPLETNQKIEIATTFRVKIPIVFSRLGHENQLYCITQWYPKPAVYDVNGWNTMPYLDQGEFYSEFGKFDVQITAPKDYVVVATGNIQQQEEIDWWLSRTDLNNIPHPSNNSNKTLRFIQDSIHDFAWFASKRFYTCNSKVLLPNKHEVQTWLFSETHKNKLKTEIKHLDNAILFYSDKVGNYPYAQATVVVTPLKAGGGMEYPTITNIAELNRQVIVHEVGHNWFYGILGTNERAFPWMDESINNYYEARSNYESKLAKHTSIGAKLKNKKVELNGIVSSPFAMLELQYLFSARNNIDQPIDLPSESFTYLNYGTIIYSKASLAFLQLQKYLGDTVFDSLMHGYFDKWKFKHPLPDDFKNFASNFTGKNLDWFFDGILHTTHKPDYAITKTKSIGDSLIVTVKNKGNLAIPIAIQTTNKDSIIFEKWLEPFTGKKDVTLASSHAGYVVLDGKEECMDVYRFNNYAKTKGVFKTTRPISFSLIGDTENPRKQQVFYIPAIGANSYNKFMLGVAFYNSIIPRKKTEYILLPLFAFGTKDINGYFTLQHRFFTNGKIREVQTGINVARFGTQLYTDVLAYDSLNNPYYNSEMLPSVYEKISPYISFIFNQKNPRTDAQKMLQARVVLVNEQQATKLWFKNFNTHKTYVNIRYSQVLNQAIRPYEFSMDYILGNAQSLSQKVQAEFNSFIDYGVKKKGLHFRVFAGIFLQKPKASADTRLYYRLAENNGYYDYMYDEAQFGRGETPIQGATLFTQQLMPTNAYFRTYAQGISTDSWLTAANVTSSLPGIIPFRIFLDVAAINERTEYTNGNTGVTTTNYQIGIHYVTGVSLWVFKDILQVNFPVLADPIIQNNWSQTQTNYGQRMTFTLKLNRLNPIKAIREFKGF